MKRTFRFDPVALAMWADPDMYVSCLGTLWQVVERAEQCAGGFWLTLRAVDPHTAPLVEIRELPIPAEEYIP